MNLINRGAESTKHDTQELVEALQAERSSMLTQVRELQLATRLLLQAEAQRLAQKNPADLRLATLALQQNTVRDRISVLDTELEVAAIRTPTVTKTDTLIHGRIADDANRAVGKLTVMLVHADGRALEGVAPVQTDASGYYAFVLDPAATANLPVGEQLSVVLRQGDNTVVPASTAAFAFTRSSVAVKDVALNSAELKRLQVQVDFPSVVVATSGLAGAVTTPRSRSGAATPKASSKTKTKTKTKAKAKAKAKAKTHSTPDPEPEPTRPGPATRRRKP